VTTRSSFPGAKVAWRDAKNSEVKNEWSYTPTIPMRLHGTCKYSFSLTIKMHGRTMKSPDPKCLVIGLISVEICECPQIYHHKQALRVSAAVACKKAC
jgi:hypothetical protein